ncbi:UNVERIFIED_ORG: hypothetical protein [Escherichia phage CMSTMSU]
MIIADETKLKYDEVNDVFSDESLALSEDSVNEAWNSTFYGVHPKESNMENIYKRVGAVLEDSTIVNSVLAYNNDDEVVLMSAGFTRTGSVEIDGEIVDVYSIEKKRKVVIVEDVNTLKDLEHLRYKFNIGAGANADKPYLKRWNTKY